MAAILDFIFSSNLGKKFPMSCFFHWILVKIYKMNKNIIETVSAKKLIHNFFSSISSATGRCAPAIALMSYPLGNTRKLPLVHRKTQ
jgi:hypothetical protein